MSSGVNHNIDGASHVKWCESQYRWSDSHQVLRSLVRPNIVFLVMSSQEGSIGIVSLRMIERNMRLKE